MTPEEETFYVLKEPAPIIDEYGTKRWFNKKRQAHRDNDLPAAVGINGSRLWFKNGKRHRANGLPAAIYNNGIEEFWENGIEIK